MCTPFAVPREVPCTGFRWKEGNVAYLLPFVREFAEKCSLLGWTLSLEQGQGDGLNNW